MNKQNFQDTFFGNSDLTPSETIRLVQDGLNGTDFGEFFQEIRGDETIVKSKGKYTTFDMSATSGFGFRAGAGERVGYCYSDIFNKVALKDAIKQSRQALNGYHGSQDMSFACSPVKFYPNVNPLQSLAMSERVKKIDEIEAYALSLSSNITNVTITCRVRGKAVQIITADGQQLLDNRPLSSLNIAITYKENDTITSASKSIGGRVDVHELFDEDGYKSAAINALKEARILQNAADAPAGEMDIVLSPGWSGVLLHEAVGHGLEGDFNRKGISVYSGKIGQQVAAKGVTVIDQGNMIGERGSLHFDDEGTPTQQNVLIEDGVLKGYMQDRQNANLMNSALTGNGRRETYKHAPMPRMTTTYFQNGTYEPDEIIKSVKDGLYIASMGGGQVDITSGKFNMAATLAYRIKNGVIREPIKGAMLIGDGLKVIESISMVGNDLELSRASGMCGKNGQSIPAGIGQPTIRVAKMTIGGTG